MSAPRYAIYYAPATDGPLWAFGSAVLGYDAATGEDLVPTAPPGCEELDWPALTAEPRRYGFHATLKAPFELAAGRTESQLRGFAQHFAAACRPVALAGLDVVALGRFVALTPSEPSQGLQKLAFDMVQAFEPFRAPLRAMDLERRLKTPLTPAQRAYLEAFGYPYVGDEFRFHMTLTGPLPAEDVVPVRAALARAHASALPAGRVAIDRIAVFSQATRDSRFRLIDMIPLG